MEVQHTELYGSFAVFGEKHFALNAYIRKEERVKLSALSCSRQSTLNTKKVEVSKR